MDKRKSSNFIRCKIEATNNKKNKVKDKKSDKKEKLSGNENNTNQDGNQSFCEKDSDKYELEMNKAHRINSIDSNEVIEYKSLDDDIEEGWVVKINNKKKTSHQTFSEEQNDHKYIQKQEKAHNKNNIDLHGDKDTNKSITKEGERRSNKKKSEKKTSRPSCNEELKYKNVQNQSKSSNKDFIDENSKRNKSHYRDDIASPKDTCESIIEGAEKLVVKINNKKKTSHQTFSEEQNDHKYIQKQEKAHDKNNIDLHGDNDTNKSITKEGERRSNKKKCEKKTSRPSCNEELKYKNVQNQSKSSNKNFIDENSKRNKSHYRDDIASPKDTCESIIEGAEKWKNKSKNNNGQKQSRFSDIGISVVLEEIDEDIFNLPNDYSLAHCVAEDLRMGAGIAVDFKRNFGGIGQLADQNLKIGDVGIVERHDQYAFYLVTKKTSNGKPTMITMEKALYSLLNKMKEYNLTKLGIPKIGCGLDKLDWSDTKLLINNIFSGSGIHITVCVPSKLLELKTPPRLKVYITPTNLWEMESETLIILFIDLEQIYNKKWTDHIIDKVDAKYPFKENLLRDIKNKKFDPGEITSYNVKNEVIICMFTTQSAYYSSIENGFKTIAHRIKRYNYLAIQSGPIDYPSDNFQHIYWIVLISRSVIYSSELWLCGNVKQTKDQVNYDEYCKNVQNSMNNSFQYNSPTQKNNFNSRSFNKKEISNQNQECQNK